MIRNFKEKLTDIKAFAFDVDGVFTDNMLTILPSGEILRQFHAKDGLAVVRATKKEYPVAIISGGRGNQVRERMLDLGVKAENIYLQSKCKIDDLNEFAELNGLKLSEILFVGDDYPDIEPMQSCGLAIAPADGADAVRQIADYTSLFKGGRGVVRDAIEQVLRANGDWFEIDEAIRPH